VLLCLRKQSADWSFFVPVFFQLDFVWLNMCEKQQAERCVTVTFYNSYFKKAVTGFPDDFFLHFSDNVICIKQDILSS